MEPRPSVVAFRDAVSSYDFSGYSFEADQDLLPVIKPFFDLAAPGKIINIIQGINVFFRKESEGMRHAHEILLYHDLIDSKPVYLAMRYDDERDLKYPNGLHSVFAEKPSQIINAMDHIWGRSSGKARDYKWSSINSDINPVFVLRAYEREGSDFIPINTKPFFEIPYIKDKIAEHKPLLHLVMASYMNSPAGIVRAMQRGVSDPNEGLVLPSGNAVGVAVANGNEEALRTLLLFPEISTNGGNNKLYAEPALFAGIENLQKGLFDIVLADERTDPNIMSYEGRTPLTKALSRNEDSFAVSLVNNPRTNINLPDRLYNMPPVIYALYGNSDKVLDALTNRPDLEMPQQLDTTYPDIKDRLDHLRRNHALKMRYKSPAP